jgi:hypothetical protein
MTDVNQDLARLQRNHNHQYFMGFVEVSAGWLQAATLSC